MRRYTNGFVGLFLQTLMVIPSGLAWAQTTSGAAHFYTTLRGIHVAGYQGWFACPGDGASGLGFGVCGSGTGTSRGGGLARGRQSTAEGGSEP